MASDKPVKNLCVRMDPKFHTTVANAARKADKSIQDYVVDVLKTALKSKKR